MKFKKGNLVEVLRGPDESCGSWFPAWIDSVDCHGYTVKFEHLLTVEGEQVVEKVHLDDVRPCPPFLACERRWTLGDVVEVFDLHSWKVGKVAKALHNNRFVIRLFGSIQLREFHNSGIRVLQAWKHNKWVRIEKVDGHEQISNTTHSESRRYHHPLYSRAVECQESCLRERDQPNPFQKISPASLEKRKSGFHRKSSPDANTKADGKRQKTTLEGCQHATGTLFKEGNIISFPETKLAEKFLHATIKENNIVPFLLDMHAMQQSSLPLRVAEENIECSVASCSGNFLPECTPHDSIKSCRDIAGSLLGDAESSCPLEPDEKYFQCGKVNPVESVHMLELHAYKSTVQALYASGPLSWEQESLLTNLRLFLHISTEEHLLQVRNLLSA